MADKKINPRVVDEMVRYDAWLAGRFSGAEREAKRIEHLLSVCRSKGLFEGPWERSTKYFVPEVAGRSGRPYKYPFHRMEVGESVFVESPAFDGAALNAAHAHGSRHGKKFTGQSEDGGVRVWRVS